MLLNIWSPESISMRDYRLVTSSPDINDDRLIWNPDSLQFVSYGTRLASLLYSV